MEHHPDIQAALDALMVSRHSAAVRRMAVERAATTLEILLRASYTSNNPAAWSFSSLTGDGFPLEVKFTTSDTLEGDLRYTVDPGGPDLPATERLSYAIALLDELGSQPPNRALLQLLAHWQHVAPASLLHYGAWIGGRHAGSSHDKAPMDRFKLYVEIPSCDQRVCQDLIAAHLNPSPYLPGQELELRILALEPTTERLEFYFRVRQLHPLALGHLLYPVGLRHRMDEFLEFVRSIYGHLLEERIPGGSVGFSYAVAPGQPVAFTLFLFSRLLWGGDGNIRRRYCKYVKSIGLDPVVYSQVTAQLDKRDSCETYHGLLGFTLAARAPIHLSLGVRPPPPVLLMTGP